MTTGDVLYIVLLGVVLVFAMDVFQLWEPLAKRINDWMNEKDVPTTKTTPATGVCGPCMGGTHGFCTSKASKEYRPGQQCRCQECWPDGGVEA